MHSLLTNNIEDIQSLCVKYSVQSLAVFGSVLRADFGPDSDIDLLVAFAPSPSGSFARYFGLKEDLETLLRRPVDLVSARAVTNPYFKQEIESSKTVLYAA